MNLEDHVRAVMEEAKHSLTVEQVAEQVAERQQNEIRDILNALAKRGDVKSIHGGGSYQTQYIKPEFQLKRRP
jgi:hypothetical protein